GPFDPYMDFNWSTIPDALTYVLWLGTSPGATDIYNSGETQLTALHVTVPANGAIYARLWTQKASGWTYVEKTFVTGDPYAHLTYPADGQTDVNPVSKFTWTAGASVAGYYLKVGTAPGLVDVFDSSVLPPPGTDAFVGGLAPNTKYYAQLWTYRYGVWSKQDTSFTTAPATLPADRADFI